MMRDLGVQLYSLREDSERDFPGVLKFVAETGNEMTAVLCELSQQLTPEAAPAPETVEPVKQAWGYNFKRKRA